MNHISKVQDLERAYGVMWGELARLEPGLNELLWQARAEAARCCHWNDVEQLFAPFRDALAELVGFRSGHRGHSLLGSVGAYEVAYWRLHDAVSGLLPRPVGLKDTPEPAPGHGDASSMCSPVRVRFHRGAATKLSADSASHTG